MTEYLIAFNDEWAPPTTTPRWLSAWPSPRPCPPDRRPRRIQHRARLGPDSDNDHLATAAYHLLRLTARQLARRSDGPVDRDALRTQFDALRPALAPIDTLERHAGTADPTAARIRATSATLKADLVERITRLDTTLSTGPTAD